MHVVPLLHKAVRPAHPPAQTPLVRIGWQHFWLLGSHALPHALQFVSSLRAEQPLAQQTWPPVHAAAPLHVHVLLVQPFDDTDEHELLHVTD
jgi:hypothetical protein